MDIPAADPVVEDVVALLRRRSAVGQAKYGTSLARTDLSQRDWLQHMIEELADALNYAMALRRMMDAHHLATRDTWDNEPSGWAGRGA